MAEIARLKGGVVHRGKQGRDAAELEQGLG